MFYITKESGLARAGKIELSHGLIETPAFFLPTQKLKIDFLESEDLVQTKTQILKTDAYELWEILGESGINFSTGLNNILKWSGPTMTDSGSFMVLNQKETKITNSGIEFSDLAQGIKDYFDSEISIKIQEEINSDIISAFNYPNLKDKNYEQSKKIMELSHNWQLRSFEAKTSTQKIYGTLFISKFRELTEESAKFLNQINFDGFMIENYIGLDYKVIETALNNLPTQKLKHFKNIKSLQEIFEIVKLGIDSFESNLPLRYSNQGLAFYNNSVIDLKNLEYSNDDFLIDEICECPVCSEGLSRKELYWLLKRKDKKAYKYLMLHNLYFINHLTELIRQSIKDKEFEKFSAQFFEEK